MASLQQEGVPATSREEAENLQKAGYTQCYTPGCNFFISPETFSLHDDNIEQDFTCPVCHKTYDLLSEPSWGYSGIAGGQTRVGYTMKTQGRLAEQIVYYLGLEDPQWIQRYGPIIWWQSGIQYDEGYSDQGELDGGTAEWGIEVKSANGDNIDPRFNIGADERRSKHQRAQEGTGVSGGYALSFQAEAAQAEAVYKYDKLLGVLVVFNFWKSVADIYVKEMPLSGWLSGQKRQKAGFANFRPKETESFHLFEEIPFRNPNMDPLSNEPQEIPF